MHFARLSCVGVGSRRLPASLLQGELNGHGLVSLPENVGASLNSSVPEEWRRLVHLGVPELHGIVQRSHIGGDWARVRALIDRWTECVPAGGGPEKLVTLFATSESVFG